jgi:hypothetical protein
MNVLTKILSLFKRENTQKVVVETNEPVETSTSFKELVIEEANTETTDDIEDNFEPFDILEIDESKIEEVEEELVEVVPTTFNIIDFKRYKKFFEEKYKTLTSDQKKLFDEIKVNTKLNICIPTGAGKGYLMMIDLLDRIINSDEKVFVISSHRLMLNEQHMDDVVELLGEMIGEIGFLFVGSSEYRQNKFNSRKDWKRKLLSKGTSYKDLFYSTTKKKEIKEKIEEHILNGRKIVISTTYHSLDRLNEVDIDTIYCDEAHILASENKENSNFSENFKSVIANNDTINTLFFTATPKDCIDEIENTFLMNNKEIFGERTGLSFKECVEAGYITRPIIHLAYPSEFKKIDIKDYVNMSKFIIETHKSHTEFIKNNSVSKDSIEAKILAKCPGVPEMWNIFQELVSNVTKNNLDIIIAAGASSKRPGANNCYYINETGYRKDDYLAALQSIPDEKAAIVLHYDTMSEGINVSGFTGTEFISADLPSKPKMLQNIGRSTRISKYDRDKLRNGIIDTKDYSKWFKPYNAVIIPFWDPEGADNSKKIAEQIKSLRDDLGFDPAFMVSIGSDISSSGDKNDENFLNKEVKIKLSKVIEDIQNEIETLDNTIVQNEEEKRIRSLSKLELLKENFGK